MAVSTRDVPYCWLRGEPTFGGSALQSRDGKLYSYDLMIGEFIDGKPVVYGYVSAMGAFRSTTTSKHVKYALAAAGVDATDPAVLNDRNREV
jgi:hypothetical protein